MRVSDHRWSIPMRALPLLVLLSLVSPAPAQPIVATDAAGDAAIRRTDEGNDGPFNPLTHRLPDIVETRLGKFAPDFPWADRFTGQWTSSGQFFRFDIVFVGLINPPGPVGYDDEFPTYSPFCYGPHPVFGYVEFDLDADSNTGGELNFPGHRYLANAGRFGGMTSEARFAGRAVLLGSMLDSSFSTPPYAERSGEEFHISLFGDHVESISVLVEKPDGNPTIFEAGETWVLRGDFLHRAHGFEDFAFKCVDRPGRYTPETKLRFAHDSVTNRTTVSIVYGLTNAACAQLSGSSMSPQPNDGCDSNDNSIEEALLDLQFSATYADPYMTWLPEFQLIAGWQYANMSSAMNPANWRTCVLVGSAYESQQPWGAKFIWTDITPNVRTGDFNGDGAVNAQDVAALLAFVTDHDGQPGYDEDKNGTNKSIDIIDFSPNFCAYDTNYDGFVTQADFVILGDKNLDQILETSDVTDFVQGLLLPLDYTNTHNGITPDSRGDINGDGVIDGRDIGGFVSLLLDQ